MKLATDKVIVNGAFGVVFEAEFVETRETVAVKKVLQDKRFKNRELQVREQAGAPTSGGAVGTCANDDPPPTTRRGVERRDAIADGKEAR